MRIDPDHCDDPVLLAAEVRRLRAVIASGDALTDAEREAVAWTVDLGDGNVYDIQNFQWEAEAIAAALLKNEGVIAKAVPLYRRPKPTLTEEEREAVEVVLQMCGDPSPATAPLVLKYATTLRGLLARMSGNGDCTEPDNTAGQDNPDRPQPIADCDATPDADATPGECTVSPEWKSRPYWVDPPSGWRYGFPRLYDPARDGNMRAWMIASGYPERLANQGLDCTFTAQTEDVG